MDGSNDLNPRGFNRKLYPLAALSLAAFGYFTFGLGGAVLFGAGFLAVLFGIFATEPDKPVPQASDPNAGGFATATDVVNAGLLSPTGVPIGWAGGHRLRYDGPRHLITVGIPRTGKGTDVIIPALLEYPGSMLVMDPKGENAAVSARQRARLGHKVYIINPYNLHSEVLDAKGENVKNRAAVNPLARLDSTSPGFFGEVRALAQALVISTGRNADSYWTDSARDLVTALIMFVCIEKENETASERKEKSAAEEGRAADDGEEQKPVPFPKTLGMVRTFLALPMKREDLATKEAGENDAAEGQTTALPVEKQQPEAQEENAAAKEPAEAGNLMTLSDVIDQMVASEYMPLRQLAAQFADKEAKDVASIIRSAQQQLSFLDEEVIADSVGGEDFDFADMKRQPITVYLVLPVEELSDKGRWLRLIVASAINSLLRGGKANPVLFLLDEFALLGNLKSVADVLGVASGLGVQLWPILQNLGQLKASYADHWEGYLATAGVVQYLSVNDQTTAKEIVARAGQMRRRITTQSTREVSKAEREQGLTGVSNSETEQWDNLLSPSWLFHLPQNQQVLFVTGSKKTFQVERLSYLDPASGLRRLADDNPYHPRDPNEPEEPEGEQPELSPSPAPALPVQTPTGGRRALPNAAKLALVLSPAIAGAAIYTVMAPVPFTEKVPYVHHHLFGGAPAAGEVADLARDNPSRVLFEDQAWRLNTQTTQTRKTFDQVMKLDKDFPVIVRSQDYRSNKPEELYLALPPASSLNTRLDEPWTSRAWLVMCHLPEPDAQPMLYRAKLAAANPGQRGLPPRLNVSEVIYSYGKTGLPCPDNLRREIGEVYGAEMKDKAKVAQYGSKTP